MLQYETILSWWDEKNADTGSRLVLILDAEHSGKWLRPVAKTSRSLVGLQTYFINRSPNLDPEHSCHVHMGDFTRDYVLYTCRSAGGSGDPVNRDLITESIDWTNPDRLIVPAYSVSRSWTNFQFHLPTDQDIMQHWNSNFPRFTLGLVKCMSCACVDCSVLQFCDCLVRCVKRKRMIWFPPKELDTRHGFSLIRQ